MKALASVAIVLYALLSVSASPTATAATPTATPSATATPTMSATATATATALPSSTATPSPSPSPLPRGAQSNGTYCTGLLGWCPDFAGMMQGVINGVLSWLNGVLGGWLGFAPAAPGGVTPGGVTPHGHTAAPTAAPTPSVSASSGSANDLVTQVLNTATTETDYTAAAFVPLQHIFGDVMGQAQKIFGLVFVIMIVVTYLQSVRHGARAWGALGLRLLTVIFYVDDLQTLLHWWAQLTGGITTSLNAGGMQNFVRTLIALLVPGVDGSTSGIALGTWDTIVALTLIAIFAVLVICLLYQRLLGFVVGALCFILMPFAIVALFTPLTRSSGETWIRTYAAISLYAPLTAAAIQVLDRTAFGLQGADPALNNPLSHAVMGLVCIGCLLAIPRLAGHITGGHITAFGVPSLRGLVGTIPALLPFI